MSPFIASLSFFAIFTTNSSILNLSNKTSYNLKFVKQERFNIEEFVAKIAFFRIFFLVIFSNNRIKNKVIGIYEPIKIFNHHQSSLQSSIISHQVVGRRSSFHRKNNILGCFHIF